MGKLAIFFCAHSFPKRIENGISNNYYILFQKAASSTWSRHFASLANPPNYQMAQWSQALQLFTVTLWPLPEKIKPAKVKKNLHFPKKFFKII